MDEKKRDGKVVRKAFRKIREGLGLSQVVLGKLAGLSSAKLARWENGQANFTEAEVERLGKTLDAALVAQSESTQGPLAATDSNLHKSVRCRYGITQEELAHRAGLWQATISLYENGHVTPDSEAMLKFQKALDKLIALKASNTTFSDLLSGSMKAEMAAQ